MELAKKSILSPKLQNVFHLSSPAVTVEDALNVLGNQWVKVLDVKFPTSTTITSNAAMALQTTETAENYKDVLIDLYANYVVALFRFKVNSIKCVTTKFGQYFNLYISYPLTSSGIATGHNLSNHYNLTSANIGATIDLLQLNSMPLFDYDVTTNEQNWSATYGFEFTKMGTYDTRFNVSTNSSTWSQKLAIISTNSNAFQSPNQSVTVDASFEVYGLKLDLLGGGRKLKKKHLPLSKLFNARKVGA